MGGRPELRLRRTADEESGFDIRIGAQCASIAATIVVIIAAIVLVAVL